MTKRLDPSIKGLAAVERAFREIPPDMWRATVDWCQDKYVTHRVDTECRMAAEKLHALGKVYWSEL